MDLVKEVFHNEESLDNQDFLSKSLKRNQENLKLQVKESIKNPILTNNENDKIVFQRNIGNLEMPSAHRWIENFGPSCHVCGKLTYTVFVWNKKLA